MLLEKYLKLFLILVSMMTGVANADTMGSSWALNYNWMNAIINKTPAENVACPSIETDVYGSGFKVAREQSFYGTFGRSGSRWFPQNAQWASVGVGPIKNSFGIYFSDINKLSELDTVKEKSLPDNFEEINKWKMSDSAYWESQGGVALYLGTGISPIDIGVFAVATGGWANFLQKTGPNKVYVEMSKKKIRTVSISGGIGTGIPGIGPGASIGKAFENSTGFAYEFTLDNKRNIEAFERFMAGDTTTASDLSKFKDSGVVKLSDMLESRNGLSRSIGIATPFIPIISFRSSSERAYDHAEENTTWDEKIVKNSGIYVKQRNIFLAGQRIKEARSFIGGKVVIETSEKNISSEKLYGNFKYAYQSNWGQENRLKKYINKVKVLTGLLDESCAKIPAFKESLGFNQVVLEVKFSDDYLREIIGLGKSKTNLLKKIQTLAQKYQSNYHESLTSLTQDFCNADNGDTNDDTCTTTNHLFLKHFMKLENAVDRISNLKFRDRELLGT